MNITAPKTTGAAVWSPSIQTITPEMALATLSESNHDNRNLRRKVVQQYARMMESGEWQLSPEPIVFSEAGRLLNGQHRLSAVVMSGTPQKFMVVSGVSADVFRVLDRGATRTTGDATGIGKHLLSVARLAAIVVSGSATFRPSDAEVERAAVCVEPYFAKLTARTTQTVKTVTSAPFRLGACARIMAGVPSDYVAGMYHAAVLCDLISLPSVGRATLNAIAAGRIVQGGGADAQRRLLSISWSVFDPKRANLTRIPNCNIDAHLPEIRNVLVDHMGRDQ